MTARGRNQDIAPSRRASHVAEKDGPAKVAERPRRPYVAAMARWKNGAERITTCCYCGARSTLPPSARRERLVCHGCGAPIRVIEALGPATGARESGRNPAIPHPAEPRGAHLPKDRPVRRKKGKTRPGLMRRLGRAFDDLDDLFDIFD